MQGEKDLKKLLQSLSPVRHSEIYVFCTINTRALNALGSNPLNSLKPLASFQEKEGLSLIVSKHEADKNGFAYEGEFNLISLNVYSSLDAVGLTAVISKKLAENNISANIVAAYHHDHLLVPVSDTEQAMRVLTSINQDTR